jgi:hypothetical protein
MLHIALVLLGGGASLEGTKIVPPAGPRVDLARIQTVAAGLELAIIEVSARSRPMRPRCPACKA